jgi:hypothetical protein
VSAEALIGYFSGLRRGWLSCTEAGRAILAAHGDGAQLATEKVCIVISGLAGPQH